MMPITDRTTINKTLVSMAILYYFSLLKTKIKNPGGRSGAPGLFVCEKILSFGMDLIAIVSPNYESSVVAAEAKTIGNGKSDGAGAGVA